MVLHHGLHVMCPALAVEQGDDSSRRSGQDRSPDKAQEAVQQVQRLLLVPLGASDGRITLRLQSAPGSQHSLHLFDHVVTVGIVDQIHVRDDCILARSNGRQDLPLIHQDGMSPDLLIAFLEPGVTRLLVRELSSHQDLDVPHV